MHMEEVNGVLFQYFHWYIPPDGSLWKELESNAASLAEKGFTAIWIPPAYKGDFGGEDVGYAVYDWFDLGEFDQKGSVRTKYGNKAELIDACAKLREHGVHVYADIVLNHLMGGDNLEEIRATPHSDSNRHEKEGEPTTIAAHTNFTFPGRNGKYSDMQWHWWHFTAVDTDANHPERRSVYLFEGKQFDHNVDLERGSYDYLMGCDVDVHNPEVADQIKYWGAWFYDQIQFEGVRFDAVKHVEAGFFPQWLTHVRSHAGKDIFAVGEYWSYNLDALTAFVEVTGGKVALFDAPLQAKFHQASKSGNSFDMRTIFDGTLVSTKPELAVTIVANHDTQPLQALEAPVEPWFKPLAYALILLRKEGYPTVFYPDYYGAKYRDKGRDGNEYDIDMPSHRLLIDRMMSVRKKYAFGDQYDYFDHPNTIGWTRGGSDEHPGGMAVVLTNGDSGMKRMRLAANADYRDATEHKEAVIRTDNEGWADFPCPAGSLSVWVPANH